MIQMMANVSIFFFGAFNDGNKSSSEVTNVSTLAILINKNK